MERPIITIEANELPCKKFSVGLVEPLFSERRLCSRRMPSQASGQKVGYTVTHLLLARCIKEINGQKIDIDPKDPVAVLQGMPVEDAQYLRAIFISAFLVDDNLAEDIKEYSTEIRDNWTGGYYTISKDKLPNGYGDIVFRMAKTSDELKVQKIFPGEENNPGYTTAELLFAQCITSINGVEVEHPKELISLFDDWTLLDQQYALGVFTNLTYMKDEQYDSAEELGKNLRGRLKGLKGGTSKPSKEKVSTTKSN